MESDLTMLKEKKRRGKNAYKRRQTNVIDKQIQEDRGRERRERKRER